MKRGWFLGNLIGVAQQLPTEHVMLAATGCRTTIEDNGGKGKMIIEYQNLDDFERVMAHFDKRPD